MAAIDPDPISTFLRRVNIATYPFAFSLTIAYATQAPHVLFPTITLVPFTASFLFCGIILHIDARRRALQHRHEELSVACIEDKHRKKRNLITFAGDVAIVAGLAPCLVFTWIGLDDGMAKCNNSWYCGRPGDWTVLATYASVPYMINMTIHVYFALLAIYNSIPSSFYSSLIGPSPAPFCPNCHHDLAASNPAAHWLGNKSGTGYALLHAGESDSLYQDIERQMSAQADGAAETRESGETAREIGEEEVAKIVDM